MTTPVETETTKEVIASLLDELPPESLAVVHHFVEFLRQQIQQGRTVTERSSGASESKTPYCYPTIPAPASSLQAWAQLLDEGYEGDALADTKAIYDED